MSNDALLSAAVSGTVRSLVQFSSHVKVFHHAASACDVKACRLLVCAIVAVDWIDHQAIAKVALETTSVLAQWTLAVGFGQHLFVLFMMWR